MKINMKDGVGIEKNAESFKKLDMKFNASMGMLLVTKYLYSNPIQTLVQEYLCNARDAMRSVPSSNDFIEITLPTKIDPLLKIRDFGPGISDDLMENVFRVIGESNKRSSDDLTGGFGIGAKSAFAYTDSFMIRSVIDGWSKLYLAHMGEAQDGAIELIDKSESTESNGLEIQINVKEADTALFHNAVYRAIQFWDKKPLLKGLLVEEINKSFVFPDPILKIENINFYKNENIQNVSKDSTNIVFLVDKIPYIVKKEMVPDSYLKITSFFKNSISLVFDLNNGDIEVAANREEINQSDFTKERTKFFLEDAISKIIKFKENLILNIKTYNDLIKFREIEKNIFFQVSTVSFKIGDLTLKSDSRSHYSIINQVVPFSITSFYIYKNKLKEKNETHFPLISSNNEQSHVILFEIDEDISDQKMKRKIKQEMNLSKKTEVYLFDDNKSNKTIPKNLDAVFKEIYPVRKSSSIELPKTKKMTKLEKQISEEFLKSQPKIMLKIIDKNWSYKYEQIILEENKKYLFLIFNRETQVFPKMSERTGASFYISKDNMSTLSSFLEKKGFELCRLQKNEYKDFEGVPNCFLLDDFLINLDDHLTLTDEEYASFAHSFWSTKFSNKFDLEKLAKSEKVIDPSFKDVINFYNKINKDKFPKDSLQIPKSILILGYQKYLNKLKEEVSQYSKKFENIYERYPLLIEINSTANLDNVIEYVNLLWSKNEN